MSASVPPAPNATPVAPQGLQDISHGAAVAPAPVSVAPAPAYAMAPIIPLHDVSHTAVAPVTASEPLPVPDPVAVQSTPLTVAPAPAAADNSVITGIVPAGPPIAPAPAPVPPAPAVAPPAPVTVPVTGVPPVQPSAPAHEEVFAPSPVAGGAPLPPVIALPDTPALQPTADTPAPSVSKAVQTLADRHGIDLRTITGTGTRGRIVRADVEAAISAAAVEAGEQSLNPAPEPVATPVPAAVAEQPLVSTPVNPVQAIDIAQDSVVVAPVEVPATENPANPSPPPVTSADAPPAAVLSTVRLPFDLSGGRTLQIGPDSDLVAMAAHALPGLMITSAVLELSADGPAVLATFATAAAVSL
ncbi:MULTISPECIES: E3 binding domain-containing protein [Mycobacteriaceae]|jgi:pyruvate/2-oxoglutarate dehydrogenase complex dihydrolipoamide acyltransferase (E2) component|uniref:E3 binding domain-containing protein n=1 Tax=Mycolicibacterium nivoides TaxID=2487344 RepID=A0ABW9LDE3_9MYCO|nr:E3 binding domain-containing protein [Mycolicibacterium conceptionense]